MKKRVVRTAFWGYDLFPYMLSGEIEGKSRKWCDNPGFYEIKGYGKGHLFKPRFIIRGKKGIELANKLRSLRAEYGDEGSRLHAKFTSKLESLLSSYGHPIPKK